MGDISGVHKNSDVNLLFSHSFSINFLNLEHHYPEFDDVDKSDSRTKHDSVAEATVDSKQYEYSVHKCRDLDVNILLISYFSYLSFAVSIVIGIMTIQDLLVLI